LPIILNNFLPLTLYQLWGDEIPSFDASHERFLFINFFLKWSNAHWVSLLSFDSESFEAKDSF